MTSRALRRSLGALCATAAAVGLAATPALADTSDPSTCSAPSLSQPWTAYKDHHWYTLAPGGTFDDAADAGWQLSGGAAIVDADQRDGTSGGVLDLPSRSVAVSPPLCITSDYPNARLSVRNLRGAEGVTFAVSYFVDGGWTNAKDTGQFHGEHSDWTLSKPMNLQPGKKPGWQLIRFVFVARGNTSHFQVDEFWVDPRFKA
jgi:hypothetical protein